MLFRSELTVPEAERFGCVAEIAGLRDILRRGTSAHRQHALYTQALAGGATKAEALKQVVDWLVGETVTGL